MNRKEQHIDQLLRRWIKGEVNRREEAELEAAAREDAFLAEAMEGYRHFPATGHDQRLQGLRARMHDRRDKRRTVFYLRRIAAAVLLLVAIGAVLMLGPMNDSQNQALSLDETPVAAPAPQLEAREGTAMADSEAPLSPTIQPEAAVRNAPTATPPANEKDEVEQFSRPVTRSSEPLPDRSDDLALDTEQVPPVIDGIPLEGQSQTGGAVAMDDELVVAEEAEEVIAETDISLPATSAPAPPPSPGTERLTAPVQAPAGFDPQIAYSNAGPARAREGYRLVEGIVTDAEGYPLIGASILQQGTTQGTITDLDGRFMMAVDSSIQQLEVNYTGYESKAVAVADDMEVVMEEGATLDEVVVTGYEVPQVQRREQADTRPPFARPEGGLDAFKDYVEGRAGLVQGRGKVRLQFSVHADGSLHDIEVIRSTNPSLNLLAQQILEEGPRWEIVAGTAPVQTVYTVRFR